MNVLLVAECTKNALTQTRRILDQFAERRGARTWQTPITRDGLATLHRLLRQTARKNTAVACHWIRGRDHSELLWIVGDASRFNTQGATPTNRTEGDVLRSRDEDDWHTGEEIRLLSSLGALFHDLGKANRAFQNKLRSNKPVADAYRHEWVSLRLFQAFVGEAEDDREWLERLAALAQRQDAAWLGHLLCDGLDDNACDSPFDGMPPLAKVVGWLILTHHRLPARGYGATPLSEAQLNTVMAYIEPDWNSLVRTDSKQAKKDTWTFDKGLPVESNSWCRHANRLAARILARPGMLEAGEQWLANPFALHVARLALMLADHYYSSGPSLPRYGDAECRLFANTQNGELKQRLDEHLIGVEVNAGRILRTLPRLEHALPRIARHKRFRQRTKELRFRWQDRAYDLACGLRSRSARQGFFGVDMASTGCGKTLANGRILYGLSNSQRGARFSIALGLRTLTLQTGDTYRTRLGLGAEDLAVLVGGGAVRELHERGRAEAPALSAATGSESTEALLPDDSYVHFAGSLEDGPLNRWLGTNPRAQRLLSAPILACTIDHLMPATEGTRGGHQIAPMLRLMSSDLVLDEPDDFGLEDLPALTRLVYWAGLLGSRVLLSSATLPPALVQGLFDAYLEGRRGYQQNRGIPGQPLNVCCAWFDEFAATAADHADSAGFLESHTAFVDQRLRKLSQVEVRRKAAIKPLRIASRQHDEICTGVAEFVHQALHELHARHHTQDSITGKRVSFGLVRMANIDPLVDVVRVLHGMDAKSGFRVYLCCYHSQHPLLVRSAIEQRLDRMLNRQEPSRIFDDPELRAQLGAANADDHVFVVLATAVAEVGRDHDYDWAIVEPSSMRSIIQLAGRVRRHRPGPCTEPNVYLLDTNIRALKNGSAAPAFCRPGFESEEFPLRSHRLSDLLTPEQLQVIDSSARIREREILQPEDNLVDLEHVRLRALLLGAPAGKERRRVPPAHWWWTTQASLTGELQRRQPFRDDPQGRQRYVLLPREDEEAGQDFYRIERDGNATPVTDSLMHELEVESAAGISTWGTGNFSELLDVLATELGFDPKDAARRFGTVELPKKGTEQGWFYHPALGFSRYR